MDTVTGGCLCGALRFVAQGAPRRVGICHCLDCRKHHGAVFYAAAVYAAADVTVTGPSARYRGRVFCPTCGGSVLAQSGAETELHLGSLDQPDLFRPQYELWTCRRESWLAPVPGAAQHDRDRPREA
ncbi:GFA family protein [Pseudooceanicola sp. CBS1P-1]|uniref:GFA family protein n=1 Tax=Pseudooceanicola albus TaxID=2692189 RepID=A0A6L7G497_9RHOB|nr:MULTISPECIES: GFA family protein [Pseudooceanicola]MBT9385656.1 GFA family protein [Pseudooceanicola endophyticus]MXN18935.1 GFA family protein [Pseudooceanicola albus]